MLGVPFRHVTGYGSGERARLALQRQEIHLYADTTPGYRGAVEGTLVKDGTVIPLWYDPHWNGKTFGKSKQVDGLPIKAFQEVYQDINGKMPSGQLWETYLALITLNGAMQRIFSLPPGAPPAAVAALRAALERLNNDKEYHADAIKTLGFIPEYYAGADAGAADPQCADGAAGDPEVRRRIHRQGRQVAQVKTEGRRRCSACDGIDRDACAARSRWPPRRRSAAQEPFYKGKRLTVMINFAAGGPTDIEGRLFARHIAKHIDGPAQHHRAEHRRRRRPRSAPTGSARSRPRTAPMIGYLTGAAWQYASEPEQVSRRLPHLRVRRLPARHRRSITCAPTCRPA